MFTLCQTPVVYTRGVQAAIEVIHADGRAEQVNGTRLDVALSQHIFARDGHIQLVRVTVER